MIESFKEIFNIKRFISLILTLLMGVMIAIPGKAAQPTVNLGSALSFAVLAGSTITNTGATAINGSAGGDVGLYPGTEFTGATDVTMTGTIYLSDVAGIARVAKDDMLIAYNDAAGRIPDTAISADLGGGTTLYPGTYNSESSIQITGTLTLDALGDADAIFVFQAGTTLTTASNSRIELINGAQIGRIFWQVGSSATLGTNSLFAGRILAMTSITANNGATVQGQLLAYNGAVTLDTNTITNVIIDVLRATIEWGNMTFNYNFGTWNPDTHMWDGDIGWNTSDFDGIKEQVKVKNYSSQPINVTFSYATDLANGDTTTGTFTKASGNVNGEATGIMTIPACPVGATGDSVPSGKTYLNLEGSPALIGSTPKKIGTITITIYT